ncbi:alpha/beta fold hydrolase [Patulibacter sp. S7RM1-6]
MAEVRRRTVETARLATSVLEAGAGEPVVLVHGNLSEAAVWTAQLAALPAGVRGLAPDLRGYGESAPAPVDARRGLRDFSDDVLALLDAEGLASAHLVGHSLGGGVVLQAAIDAPERVRSLTVVAPVGPHGYGGTLPDGRPCSADFAGSGGGTANPDLVARIAAGDRGDESPVSPRNVVRTLFFPDPDAVRDEELLLEGILRTRVDDDHYPGDARPSDAWPGTAPGERGVLNALSPRFLDLTAFADVAPRPPVLWVRGTRDAIVADGSLTDVGHLGAIGALPDWPGEDVHPAQPMVAQTARLLERYRAAGGAVREVAWEGAGHFPYLERPDAFAALLAAHVHGASR